MRLGAEPQGAVAMRVEQRLLAQPVAGDQQPAAPAVPEREGEHAAQPVDAVVAEVLVEVDDHLGVAAGAEPVPAPARAPTRSSR